MKEEDFEVAIKVVIVGNGGVGKSSMIQRYCKGRFTKDYKKTIGVDFLERQITVDEDEVRIMLWDTAGQEEFNDLTREYYKGAQAVVLAFSTIDRDSFLAIRQWKEKVSAEVGSVPMVLIQNKIDLVDQAEITADESESLAKKLNLKFYRTSVKDDLNVSDVFRYLAAKYLKQLAKEEGCEELVPVNVSRARDDQEQEQKAQQKDDAVKAVRVPEFENTPSKQRANKKSTKNRIKGQADKCVVS